MEVGERRAWPSGVIFHGAADGDAAGHGDHAPTVSNLSTPPLGVGRRQDLGTVFEPHQSRGLTQQSATVNFPASRKTVVSAGMSNIPPTQMPQHKGLGMSSGEESSP